VFTVSHSNTHIVLTAFFSDKHGLAGCSLDVSNKWFRYEFLRSGCSSWRQPAKTQ